MIDEIKVLKETHDEMGKVLECLTNLEDGVDADYREVTADYRWLLNDLRHRCKSLRMRRG